MQDAIGVETDLAKSVDCCRELQAISSDFHDLMRLHCERCRNGVGKCVVSKLKAAAFEERLRRQPESDCA